MKFKDVAFPLKFMQVFLAFMLAVGCFLGFPNDAQLGGLFWAMTFVTLVLGVIDNVLQNRQSDKGR